MQEMGIHKSHSLVQIKEEDLIFQELCRLFECNFDKKPRIFLGEKSYIEPDFYSEDKKIVGEIYTHQGKLLEANCNKISSDCAKMMLLEMKLNCDVRKIFVINDENIKKYLAGNAWRAELIRSFGIEVLYIEITPERREALIQAQKLQKEGMKEA